MANEEPEDDRFMVLSKAYTPTDCLDYKRSANCETLREELIDRTSHGEIPNEAIDSWWGEVEFEEGLFVVYIYYRPEEKHLKEAPE